MLKKQTLQEAFSLQSLLLMGVVATLLFALLGINREASAASSTDYYTDYAGGKQSMRIVKAQGNKRPAIVYVHGGGWAVDGGTFNPRAQDYAAKQGFTSFRIKYRLMPGGVVEQLNDVLLAVQHVKKNAKKYNIDPNKIAIMGDSAGGSLTVRAAATGKSGAAAAVGLSAPTNAFRDLFNSWKGFADGMFHSRCIGEYFPPFTMDVINFFVGDSGATLQKIGAGKALSPAESNALLTQSLGLAGIVISDLPSTFGRLDKAANDFGFSATPESGNTETTDTPPESLAAAQEEVKQKLSTLDADQLASLGTAIFQFNRSAQNLRNDQATSGDVLQTLSILQQGLGDVIAAQNSLSQAKANAGNDPLGGLGLQTNSPLLTAGDSSSNGNTIIGINPQQISASKMAQCMDDFIQLSPSLYASPRTPPTLLVNYTTDELVNPQDAYQMRDKLRSMGIRSEVYMRKGSGPQSHLGYERWIEKPVYKFLHSVLRSSATAAAASPPAAKTASTAGSSQPKTSPPAGSSSSNQSAPAKPAPPAAKPAPANSSRSIKGKPLYVFQASDWKNRPKAIYANQVGKWYGNWTRDITGEVSRHVGLANSKGSLPLLVAYNIPNRDCGSYSAGGAGSSGAYRSWIDKFAKGVGNRKAIIILEPDALPQTDCLNQNGKKQRIADLSYAVNTFKSRTQASVYIDAGHPRWKSAKHMAGLLKQARVSNATGFSINVSNFIPTNENVKYGDAIVAELRKIGVSGSRFVIDTSRNGKGARGSEWCNPRGRGLGVRPTTNPGGSSSLDAYLWIKTIGESDGECGRGDPAAGQWFPSYANELIKNRV